MTREEREEKLQSNKQRELAKYATTLGIKGAHDLRKAELIEAILEAENIKECVTPKQSAVDKKEIEVQSQQAEVTDKVEKKATGINIEDLDIDMDKKMPYIEGAEIGMIVAFVMNGRAKSAMIVKKSTKKRRFMLETKHGAQYIVPYDNIIWVRKGNKWPRGIYKLLKGIEDGGNGKKD